MAYSKEEWAIVKAFFERGLSLSEIVKREEVVIKSKSQISKKANAEGWIKNGEKKQLFEKEIETKQAVIAIKEQKETFDVVERNVNDTLVEERTKHLQFFTDSTMRNMKVMMEKINEVSSIGEHRVAQAALKDAKEVVIGKTPDTAIQINNNGNDKPLTLADFYAGKND